MAQNRQDMGSGPVKPLLLQLMIPAVVAQVVNLLYNIVDRIYIGQMCIRDRPWVVMKGFMPMTSSTNTEPRM